MMGKTDIDIHADDFALSVNTSRDILNGICAGRLTSVSILPNMNCFDECLKLWEEKLQGQKNPPDASIHLNFVEGRCVGSPEGLPDLTDSDGYFKTSWKKLFLYSFSPRRSRVKRQLKEEIRAQIEKVRSSYHMDAGLRIDSHQHTHMIPVIFEALTEVIRENGYPIAYIRNSHDLLLPYLLRLSLLPTYRPVNIVKVVLLNFLSPKVERDIKKRGLSQMYLCGVFLSGKMDRHRLEKLVPFIWKTAVRRHRELEILFHPGTLLKKEAGRDFPDRHAVAFYLSENRAAEYDTVLRHKPF